MAESRKRRLVAGIAAVGALALAASACSSSKTTTTQNTTVSKFNTINSATVKDGGSITVAVEKQLGDWDPTDSSISADQAYALNGIYYAGPFIALPDGTVVLNKDFLDSATVTSQSPLTIVYKVKSAAVWSDGKPIDASDFIYYWLVNSGADPNMANASSTGYQDIASVVGSGADNKTVTVTWKPGKAFPDWQSLFGYLLPAHVAQTQGYDPTLTIDTLTTEGAKTDAKGNPVGDPKLEASYNYFTNTPPTVSSGPYMVQSAASDNNSVVEVKNPKWYGTPAHLDSITFKTITDATQEPPALANGEVQVAYPQPETDLVTAVKNIGSKVKNQISAGFTFEHFDFNLTGVFGGKTEAEQTTPAKLALRQAVFTATDRRAIIAHTEGLFDPASTTLNNRFFVPLEKGYTDNVTKYGLGSGDVTKATSILQKAGYTGIGTKLVDPSGTPVPTIVMRYTVGNALRQTECNLFAQEMSKLGITVNVETTTSLGKSLTHKTGYDYDIIVFAWLDTPFPNSGNYSIFVSKQGQNYGGLVSAKIDSMYAKAVGDYNTTEVNTTLNQMDDYLSQQAITLPLFLKDSMVIYDSNLGNIRDNSTNQLFTYNVQEWGLVSGSASPTS